MYCDFFTNELYYYYVFTRMKKAVFFFLFICSFALSAQDRGLEIKVKEMAGEHAGVGRQYAVLIGIDRYQRWLPLKNPVSDATDIKKILSRKYYIDEFVELYDEAATKSGIIRLFSNLIQKIRPEDSIFIFYAGHGHLDKMSNTGFWIPVDGGTDEFAQENWLSNQQIRGYVSKLQSRHVAIIVDSCFSGDIFTASRGNVPAITSEYFKNAYSRVSRQVLTSGALETVPDDSPFARQLKLALEGNTRPYLDVLQMYSEIRLGVSGTTPLFGSLNGSGHQNGASFIFFRREQRQAPPRQPTRAAKTAEVTITIAESYGSLNVVAKTEGELFIDNQPIGKIPAGRSAKLDNIGTGEHIVEMRYDGDERETLTVRVIEDAVSEVSFSYTAKKALFW